MNETESKSVAILKALADPMRLEILSHFAKKESVSCGDIRTECARSQPTVSHHMARLVESGVLIEQKEGTQKSYQLNGPLLKEYGLDINRLI